ncbi:MAG: hemerythrin domain-containing protein [Bacteroidales bacterium]|nr:hemerythrin domain-containing protein [Bacteroidales bacterium]
MFTKKTRFADMFSANNNLVLLMPRLGIGLGVGNLTVDEVSVRHGVSSDFVLMVCNIYTFRDYVPTQEELAGMDMTMLVPYLRASHTYYVKERMPHLERHLTGVLQNTDKRYAEAMMLFFKQYRQEMCDHFEYEEKDVYPRLQQCGRMKMANPQNREYCGASVRLAESHEGMVDKISDLLQILYKYMPSHADTEEMNELIFGLLQLSSDFERHAAIEEHVLLPYLNLAKRVGK